MAACKKYMWFMFTHFPCSPRVQTFLDKPGILDQVEWKRYWHQNQRYETLCINCLSLENEEGQRKVADEAERTHSAAASVVHWGPVFLQAKCKMIMKKWYLEAKDRMPNATSVKHKNEISDDDEDDYFAVDMKCSDIQIEPKASKIASSWLTIARFNINRKGS